MLYVYIHVCTWYTQLLGDEDVQMDSLMDRILLLKRQDAAVCVVTLTT